MPTCVCASASVDCPPVGTKGVPPSLVLAAGDSYSDSSDYSYSDSSDYSYSADYSDYYDYYDYSYNAVDRAHTASYSENKALEYMFSEYMFSAYWPE